MAQDIAARETTQMTENGMPAQALELRCLALIEAAGCDAHADEMAELAVQDAGTLFGPTLLRQARLHRVRALELRGQAATLATQSD